MCPVCSRAEGSYSYSVVCEVCRLVAVLCSVLCCLRFRVWLLCCPSFRALYLSAPALLAFALFVAGSMTSMCGSGGQVHSRMFELLFRNLTLHCSMRSLTYNSGCVKGQSATERVFNAAPSRNARFTRHAMPHQPSPSFQLSVRPFRCTAHKTAEGSETAV